MKLPKKADLPPEVAKGIEDQLKAMYPGSEIKFTGDSTPPPYVVSEIDQLEAAMRDSIVYGNCLDCGKKIPGEWPPVEESSLPDGWSFFSNEDEDDDDGVMFLVCPDCDKDTKNIIEVPK